MIINILVNLIQLCAMLELLLIMARASPHLVHLLLLSKSCAPHIRSMIRSHTISCTKNGTTRWTFLGRLHREGDLPAVEHSVPATIIIDGMFITSLQEWWHHGQRHRENGPAIISRGFSGWWYRGKNHRLGGPAMLHVHATNATKYKDHSGNIQESIVEIKSELWKVDGKFHRADGPAMELYDGTKKWYQHGQLHRVDGPAVVNNYLQRWYIHDVCSREMRVAP
jgi:hypothetical protein